MRLAIEDKNKSTFMGRELRIKKAVAPDRLEKKARKRDEKVQNKQREKYLKEVGYDTEDSEGREAPKDVEINKKSKKIKKDRKEKEDELRSYIAKIQAKAEKAHRDF